MHEKNDVSEQMQIPAWTSAPNCLNLAVRPTRWVCRVTHTITEIREKYDGKLEADQTTGELVGVAGRVVCAQYRQPCLLLCSRVMEPVFKL